MISINDLLTMDYFRRLKVLAGAGGLSNQISGCAILDYEMDRALSKKYAIQNFHPGRLVITSLMFAKDNPFLVGEAVKHIISIGGCGMIIKNVFKLPIHDTVLRHAEFRNFPILLMDDDMFFETFIIKLNKLTESSSDAEEDELRLERLLHQELPESEKKDLTRRLFPVFRDKYAFIRCEGDCFREMASQEAYRKIAELRLPISAKGILHGDKGFFLFMTDDGLSGETVAECAGLASEAFPGSFTGQSDLHYWIRETDTALKEALYASMICRLEDRGNKKAQGRTMRYSDIGIYRVLLPFAEDETMQDFSDSILSPVIAFDAENRGSLLETLLTFVRSGGILKYASELSSQHENTIRYRLDKIASLTGLSFRKPDEYEQLALAARIYLLMNRPR